MNHWSLIQFKPNSHRLAERNLHQQGFETFLPMQEITRRKAFRFVNELKPLFPGYMFVNLNTELALWRSIKSTIGVSRIVGCLGNPQPLPKQIVSGLMHRCDASGTLMPTKNLNTGDSVELLSGPFANFIATVDKIDPGQRIWLLMDFMGHKTRMRASADQLQLST